MKVRKPLRSRPQIKILENQAIHRLIKGKNTVLVSEISEKIAYHLHGRDRNNSQKTAEE